ncbi:MAG TPA: acetyl-CoA carboxylase biotin carboxyl carrier protein [Bacteroidota bacterium]|nr:acetyl-CoA carboxylase biotin carboxyl carrier protein [Bacteroidota bacterium]
MDLAYLKKLVHIVERSSIDEIEVEEEGLRVRVARNLHGNSSAVHTSAAAPVVSTSAVSVSPASSSAAASAPDKKYHEVKSPIVGTFYRAPAPDADPYVEVGQVVQPKTVLCIIEAMKLMNEIECDASGKIVNILVENGKPVEYNQTLFLIEPQ